MGNQNQTAGAKAVTITVGSAGALMLAAAQTKPEDAISNIAGWAHMIGIDNITLPANIDTIVSIAGSAMFLLALGFWLYRRWVAGKIVRDVRAFITDLRSRIIKREAWESDSDILDKFEAKVTKLDTLLASHAILLPTGYFKESPEDVVTRFEGIAGALDRGDLEAAKAAAQRE